MNKIKHLLKYYVYRHIRLDSNTPFYVGKGQGTRAFNLKERNQFHKNIAKKYNCKIEILKYFSSEKEAFNFEKKLIKLYKSLGYCETNITDGGDGISGFKHSQKTIQNAVQVNRDYWSKPGSRLKASLLKQKFRWITPNGVFNTAQQAADFHKIFNATVRNYCKDTNKPNWYKQGALNE